MIERDKLPADAADWTKVVVKFPRLSPDSAKSCPIGLRHIWDYLKTESGDTDQADRKRFQFLRTAKIRDQRMWIWRYIESNGEATYVLVQQYADGGTMLGVTSTKGLSPEQYMLAAYYEEVDWS